MWEKRKANDKKRSKGERKGKRKGRRTIYLRGKQHKAKKKAKTMVDWQREEWKKNKRQGTQEKAKWGRKQNKKW